LKVFREPVVPKSQMLLLPPSVNDYVPKNSPARIVSEIIDSMNHDKLYAKYRGGGAPAYDPKIMLKLIVFGYSQGVRSSRKIDAALGQDMRFMFLSEMSRPDFRTISRFRKENLEAIDRSFAETMRVAMEMGLVLLEHVSVAGAKPNKVSGDGGYFSTETIEYAAAEGIDAYVPDSQVRKSATDASEPSRGALQPVRHAIGLTLGTYSAGSHGRRQASGTASSARSLHEVKT
jgi:transposase